MLLLEGYSVEMHSEHTTNITANSNLQQLKGLLLQNLTLEVKNLKIVQSLLMESLMAIVNIVATASPTRAWLNFESS